MSKKSAGGSSAEDVLALLSDPAFRADAQRTLREAAAIAAQASTSQDGQLRLEELGQRFFDRWGVPPPTTSELLDPDPRRRVVDAIAAGRWGLVLVFPATTNRQIRGSTRTIRPVVRKQHLDALITRHAQLVGWLEAIGFDRPTIARVVFHRRAGLRRPTRRLAVAHTSEQRERQLHEHYRGLGLPEHKIEQAVYKRLQGSEAPASAVVRMTEQRYVKRLEHLNAHLAAPVHSEPLSHALTMLFRGLPDGNDATVRRHAVAVQDALLDAAAPLLPAHGRDVPSLLQLLEMTLSGRWGVVPVFGWTTDPKIRATVTKIRTMMRLKPVDHPGARATRPIPFEPLSDALITLLRTLTDQDDAAVQRAALKARAAFLQAETS
jgi:hypothetical protein